jgi:hypothetical protein
MLMALPNTQLSRRLAGEGRLRPDQDISFFDPKSGGDQCTAGLNFETVRPRSAILNDYKRVLEQIYDPAAFFARVRMVGRLLRRPKLKTRLAPATLLNDICTLGRLTWWLLSRQPDLIRPFCGALLDCARHNPAVLKQVVSQMVMYLHAGPFSREVISFLEGEITKIHAGELMSGHRVITSPSIPIAVGPASAVAEATAGLP